MGKVKELVKYNSVLKDLIKEYDLEIQRGTYRAEQNSENYLKETSRKVSARDMVSAKAGIENRCSNVGAGCEWENTKEELWRKENLESEISNSYTETKKTVTLEEKTRKIIELLQQVGKSLSITLIIDELDKYSGEEIVAFINKNKRLFFDCNITTILVTDVNLAIYLEEKSHYIYKDNMILVRSLNLIDFIARGMHKETYEIGEGINFFCLLAKYYNSKMNSRKIGFTRDEKFLQDKAKGFLFYCFLSSCFYSNLSEGYKEIFAKFYWEFLELLEMMKQLKWSVYDNLMEEFKRENKIESIKIKGLLNKLKEIMLENEWKYSFDLLGFADYRQERIDREKEYEINKFLRELAIQSNDIFNKDGVDLSKVDFFKLQIDFENYLKKQSLDRSIVDYFFKIYKENKVYSKTRSKMTRRFAKDEDYELANGIDDAKKIVRKKDVIGAILFYPNNEKVGAKCFEKPLQNGILVEKSYFGEVTLYPYVGYIGLHSHKPHRMVEFKKFLEDNGVRILELSQKDTSGLWKECFDGNDNEKRRKILEVCDKYLDEWLNEISN